MTPGGHVLIVEDETAISDAIAFHLKAEGHLVDAVADGHAALRLDPDAYDVLVLDAMLPGLSGFEVCRRVRARSTVPVIMLTARTSEADRVLGLELGADDYVGKPFSMRELVGRVRAVLRRRELDRLDALTCLDIDGLHVDLVERSVTVDGHAVGLTPLEFRLVAFLASRAGEAVSRAKIMQHLWHTEHPATSRTCDTHVKNLRQKIEPDPARPRRLVTVRGVGYMLGRS